MKLEHTEEWYSKSWRPAAAFVYLFICIIDFSIMPLYCEWLNQSIPIAHLVELSLGFSDPIIALKLLTTIQVWSPVTLAFNGLFHAAFGAVLGVSAWQRGKEKVARIQATVVDAVSTDIKIPEVTQDDNSTTQDIKEVVNAKVS